MFTILHIHVHSKVQLGIISTDYNSPSLCEGETQPAVSGRTETALQAPRGPSSFYEAPLKTKEVRKCKQFL